MKLSDMKEYLALCLEGESSIPQRQEILDRYQRDLEKQKNEIQKSIDYIDWKQTFYSDVLSGKTDYYSNLINVD